MLRVRAATRRGGGQVLDIARGLWRWYDGWLVRDMIGNWVYDNGYSSGKGFCVTWWSMVEPVKGVVWWFPWLGKICL